MNIIDIMPALMFAGVCLILLMGFPVAFSLAGGALLFAGVGLSLGVFDASFLDPASGRIVKIMTSAMLSAVPTFIFMGVMLQRSGIAEDLLDSMARIFGRFPGGLGISVIFVGALLAASTGIVGATVVTMGLIALPGMLNRGYSPSVASGTIAASGTLGQIIPPSIVLVLLGDVLTHARSDAKSILTEQADAEKAAASAEAGSSFDSFDDGAFDTFDDGGDSAFGTVDDSASDADATGSMPLSIDEQVGSVSVGDLFMGAVIPGLILVVAYISYIIFLAIFKPSTVPAMPRDESTAGDSIARAALQFIIAFFPPLLLIIAVLGSILTGAATPTQGGAIGAAGATILALLRGRLNWQALHNTGKDTVRMTAMVFMILIGSQLFVLVFKGFQGHEQVYALLESLPGGLWGALLAVMLLMFILGFFLDFIEIVFVIVPLAAPILIAMGADPTWLGVLIALNLQTSFLTPPFGFSLFYLRGVAPQDQVKTSHIYLGVLPFILIQLLVVAAVAYWQDLATWLPSYMSAAPPP